MQSLVVPSRSHLVPISFSISFWFLLLLNFPCCDEWVVHSVICCQWCESWNELSLCSTQCAHGLAKAWWCQWMCWMSRAQCDLLLVAWEFGLGFPCVLQHCAVGFVKIWWCQWMCWMSRAQCDLLLVAWESDWVFLVFYNTVRLVLLRFGDASGCVEWAVHSVICSWRCEFWRWREIRFFCVPAIVAWVLGRWRELRPPPSNITLRNFGWLTLRWLSYPVLN